MTEPMTTMTDEFPDEGPNVAQVRASMRLMVFASAFVRGAGETEGLLAVAAFDAIPDSALAPFVAALRKAFLS